MLEGLFDSLENSSVEIIHFINSLSTQFSTLSTAIKLKASIEKTLEHPQIREIENNIEIAILNISNTSNSAYNKTTILKQNLEAIIQIIKNHMNRTEILLTNATERQDRTIAAEVLAIIKELEDQRDLIASLTKIIDTILIPYLKNLSEENNLSNYKNAIIEECKSSQITQRLEIVKISLQEKILQKEIKNKISRIEDIESRITNIETLLTNIASDERKAA